MKTIKGNIWDYWQNNCFIIIPTNGFVKKDGSLVMGKGLALQAKNTIHNIEYLLGKSIKTEGNKIFILKEARTITFPVKYNWWEKADLNLIEKSAQELKKLADNCSRFLPIYLPKVGCGNGKLNWKDVEPILDKYLDERFIVVDLN